MNSKYRFILAVLLLFCGWFLLEKHVLYSPPLIRYSLFVNHLVLKALIYPTQWILELMGFETVTDYNILRVVGSRGIRMANPCLGINLFAVFLMLPLAYPAPWKSKIVFMVSGIFIIHLLNIIRMTTLSLTLLKFNDVVPFEYHDSFNFIIYVLIFIMWFIFIRIIERRQKKQLA